MFQKLVLKQLRHWGVFLVQFGTCTSAYIQEVAYQTLVRPRPQLEYAAPTWHPYNETEAKKVEKVQKTAVRWVCRRWHNTSSINDMLEEWPSLEDRRLKSSLIFFYKIHSGTVSLDKDRYLTLAPRLRYTRDIPPPPTHTPEVMIRN